MELCKSDSHEAEKIKNNGGLGGGMCTTTPIVNSPEGGRSVGEGGGGYEDRHIKGEVGDVIQGNQLVCCMSQRAVKLSKQTERGGQSESRVEMENKQRKHSKKRVASETQKICLLRKER